MGLVIGPTFWIKSTWRIFLLCLFLKRFLLTIGRTAYGATTYSSVFICQWSSSLPNADYFTFLAEDFFKWTPSEQFDLIFDYTYVPFYLVDLTFW